MEMILTSSSISTFLMIFALFAVLAIEIFVLWAGFRKTRKKASNLNFPETKQLD